MTSERTVEEGFAVYQAAIDYIDQQDADLAAARAEVERLKEGLDFYEKWDKETGRTPPCPNCAVMAESRGTAEWERDTSREQLWEALEALRDVVDGMGALTGGWWDLAEPCGLTEERAKEVQRILSRQRGAITTRPWTERETDILDHALDQQEGGEGG